MLNRDGVKERIDKYVAEIPDDPPDEYDDGEVELEYHVATITSGESVSGPDLEPHYSPDQWLEMQLNDGWQIDRAIVCGDKITYVFSREKESE